MNQSFPQEALDAIARECRHFSQAPEAFFQAWKRGAQIAGHEWFGDGTREGLQRATDKWDLRPNLLRINDALGVLSGGQRMFLAAMVSVYNSREGGAMLKRCQFEGLSDFGCLDLERRKVLADLLLNYNGWRLALDASTLSFFPPREGHASPSGAMSLLLIQGVTNMPRAPSIAVVIEGGLVQDTLVENWPGQVPLPRIVIVDYDDDDTPEDELTTFNIGNEVLNARCHEEIPSVYESFTKPALSPRAVLRALGVTDDDDDEQTPLEIARHVRQEILDLDARLNATEQAPTGSDYNVLYALANCGLIEVLKSLGDSTNFGE